MNIENNRFYYKVYGLEVESKIELKEFVSIQPINNENIVKIVDNIMSPLIKEQISNGERSAFSKDEVWFHIDNIATYRVSKGNLIEFEPCETPDPYLLRVFLMCSCLGLIMIQRDIIAIHGGTIIIDNKAVIITGDRGAGKSTLTTALRLKGYPFISDDVAALVVNEKVMVKHGFPYQKLCTSAMDRFGYDKEKYFSFTSDKEVKYLVEANDDFIFEDTELFAICEIAVDDVDEVIIQEIKGNEKLLKIINNRYRAEFISAMGGTSSTAFRQLLNIAKRIEFFKIIRPRNKFTVDKQIELLEEKIKILQES